MGFTKRVDKHLSETRFEVLQGLHSGLNITQLSKIRHVSRQAIYKVIKSLIEKGLLERIGYSYSLTQKGIEGLHSFVGLRYKLRQHNFHIKFSVLESNRNWNKKRNEFRKLSYFNKSIKLKNNEQELFNYGNLTIKTTTKSIIVKLPTIYAKDLKEATRQTFDILEETYPKIEALFKVKLVKNNKSCMEVICQEYANMQDELAKLYEKKGEFLLITGEDGKVWQITDASFNTEEREMVHSVRASDDQEAISKSMNILREEPEIMKENKLKIGEQEKVISKSMEVLEGYAKQIALHLEVEQAQEKHLKDQTKHLKDQTRLFTEIGNTLKEIRSCTKV